MTRKAIFAAALASLAILAGGIKEQSLYQHHRDKGCQR